MGLTQTFSPTTYVPWRIPWATGRFYTGLGQRAGSATLSTLLNNLYCMPVYVPNPAGVTVTSIGINITVLGTSSNVRMAIYTMDTWSNIVRPDTLVIDAGSIATASTGFKSISISQVLKQGFYYVLGLFYGTSTPTCSASAFSTFGGDAGSIDYQDLVDYQNYYTIATSTGLTVTEFTLGFPKTFAPFSIGSTANIAPTINTARPSFVLGI